MTVTESQSTLAELTAGTWNIDPSHSSVSFVVRHMMVSKVRGHFGTFTGTITIGENRLDSSVEATVDTTSINTNDEKRDAHLRGADFFDTETFPTLTFRTSRVEQSDGDFLVH